MDVIKIILLITILTFTLSLNIIQAGVIEGTDTYQDYLFILVHGWNADKTIFTGEGGYKSLKYYLEKPISNGGLGLEGKVYTYSYSSPSGDYLTKAKELGSRNYKNPSTETNGLCWLEQAKIDYKKWFKSKYGKTPTESEVPSRYIILSHSAGNFSVRSYIYSNVIDVTPLGGGKSHKKEDGFYQNDIDKVVFIAAPFTGTGTAFLYWQAWFDYFPYFGTKTDKWIFAKGDPPVTIKQIMDVFDLQEMYKVLKGNPTNPWSPYYSAATFSGAGALGGWFIKSLYGISPNGSRVTVPFDPSVTELFPSNAPILSLASYFSSGNLDSIKFLPVSGLFLSALNGPRLGWALKDAKLTDATSEPAYSIVYANGIPTYDPTSTAFLSGLKWMFNHREANSFIEFFSESFKSGPLSVSIPNPDWPGDASSSPFIDSPVIDFMNNAIDTYFSLNFQESTLFHPGFWALPNWQSKFLSLSMARTMDKLDIAEYFFGGGYFTLDGDFVVPGSSARGEGVAHLKNVPTYLKEFKSDSFENYLSNQFALEVAATETAIATAAYISTLSGIPYWTAWENYWWMRIPASLSLVNNVYTHLDQIRTNLDAHNRILEEQNLIRTAILDTPAIFTVQDIQTTKEEEATASSSSASGEVTAMSITTPRTPPSGYQSLKIKSINEKRVYYGNQNMAIPITIDGDRKYITEILVTKPPKRIEGKLNYLIPKLMKQFQYSFNHAAWKNIKNVHPVTGEFVLENLPFAEGQNTLAIRATNAVGVKSHQLCKFVLNTIPMLISNMTPKPNTYTNNPQPIVGGSFIKSVYTENTTIGEGIPAITSAKLYLNDELLTDLLSDPNFTQQNVKVNDYRTEVNFSYQSPVPLKDGQYKIVVEAKSEVGASRGEWPFWVDTTPPEITFEIKMVPK
ncbi:hypothetical protein ACFL52_00735 [Candidatus Margulisiibacteriota bacterium]